MKKEITYERLLEILCETGERVPVSYKTLDIETPLEPAMEGVEKAFDSFSRSAYNAIKRTKIKKK